jgi:hypothetical protein
MKSSWQLNGKLDEPVFKDSSQTQGHSTLGSGLSKDRIALVKARARSVRRLHQGGHDRPASL